MIYDVFLRHFQNNISVISRRSTLLVEETAEYPEKTTDM